MLAAVTVYLVIVHTAPERLRPSVAEKELPWEYSSLWARVTAAWSLAGDVVATGLRQTLITPRPVVRRPLFAQLHHG